MWQDFNCCLVPVDTMFLVQNVDTGIQFSSSGFPFFFEEVPFFFFEEVVSIFTVNVVHFNF